MKGGAAIYCRVAPRLISGWRRDLFHGGAATYFRVAPRPISGWRRYSACSSVQCMHPPPPA
eukprot:scaffold32566_cov75-Isochrysis_galbana.AAC.2